MGKSQRQNGETEREKLLSQNLASPWLKWQEYRAPHTKADPSARSFALLPVHRKKQDLTEWSKRVRRLHTSWQRYCCCCFCLVQQQSCYCIGFIINGLGWRHWFAKKKERKGKREHALVFPNRTEPNWAEPSRNNRKESSKKQTTKDNYTCFACKSDNDEDWLANELNKQKCKSLCLSGCRLISLLPQNHNNRPPACRWTDRYKLKESIEKIYWWAVINTQNHQPRQVVHHSSRGCHPSIHPSCRRAGKTEFLNHKSINFVSWTNWIY